jgi:hypothetical protein
VNHLTAQTFVDLLDGAQRETDVPHLAACAACRQHLADIRAAWQATADVEAPEPSPLFWDHLAVRVREAVAAEPRPRASWWEQLRIASLTWRIAALASAAAAVALVVTLQVPRNASTGQQGAVSTPPSAQRVPAPVGVALPALADDESMRFVADLASGIDWETAGEIGLRAEGGADRVVSDLDDGERVELRRLLTEAMAGGVS